MAIGSMLRMLLIRKYPDWYDCYILSTNNCIQWLIWLKWLLGRQPALCGHSRDTRRALAFRLGHSRVTCVSPQLHLSFTRSFLIQTSYTCGSLGQQSVQWMLHNWIIRAWKPASSKHSPVLWFSAKALPCFVTSMSLEKPLSPFRVSMKTLIVHC